MNRNIILILIITLALLVFLFLINFNNKPTKNATNQEISKEEYTVIDYSDDYNKVINQVQKPNDIINFLNNNNFKYISSDDDSDVDLEKFYNSKQGRDIDFAFFIGKSLAKNYIPFLFAYEDNYKTFYVVAFRDDDLPKYIYVDNQGVHMVHHGWSFNDLCKKEEERLGIKIQRYGTLFLSSGELETLESIDWVSY